MSDDEAAFPDPVELPIEDALVVGQREQAIAAQLPGPRSSPRPTAARASHDDSRRSRQRPSFDSAVR